MDSPGDKRHDNDSGSGSTLTDPKKRRNKNNPFAVIANTSDIDYIGNGPYQVSQLNVLQKRSVEPFKDYSAKLSARGLAHRSGEHFQREAQNASMVILGELRQGKKSGGRNAKPAAYLFHPYFQRGLANEKLNEIDKAISDYTDCLRIEPKFAPAYFNRAGLYRSLGNMDAAIADLNTAVQIDPTNTTYRSNRSLIFRQKGLFLDAIQDTMINRAMSMIPSIIPEIAAGSIVPLDSEMLSKSEIVDDPILKVLRKPVERRKLEDMGPVVDFLETLKFFKPFAADKDFMAKIAIKITMVKYEKGDTIFLEGAPGLHYHMILDGEVSIVKIVKDDYGSIIDTITLVKLFRGQAFGETALEGKGVRTAGAVATQNTNLLGLHVNDYTNIMLQYKSILHAEVLNVLSTVPIFQSVEHEKLKHLSTFAVVKYFGPHFEIVKVGQLTKQLFIIRKGIVKLVKSIEKPSVSHMTFGDVDNGKAKEETPGLWVMEQNWRDRLDMFGAEAQSPSKTNALVEFTVGVLGSGQVFGELSVLDQSKSSPITAISYTGVELYVIDGEVLVNAGIRFNNHCMESLSGSLSMHNPPSDKLHYYFRSKYAWEMRKAKLLKSITGKDQENDNKNSKLPKIEK